MGKRYFKVTILLLLIAFAGVSQITITTSDLLSKDDTIRMSNAAVAGIPDPALTGTNYTWDYSLLNPTIQYVDTFVKVTSTPFAYQLYFNNPLSPKYKANFAQKTSDIKAFTVIQLTNIYNYFKNSVTEYSIVGFGATINGVPTSVKYDSIDVVYKFPMNYGNKDSTISKYMLSIPTIGSFGQRKKRVNHIEGWGTVKTPFGTFQALKIKSTLYITDTIYYTTLKFGTTFNLPTQYEYKWLAAGKRVPVLEIDATGSTVTRVAYRDSIRAGVPKVGIDELEQNADYLVYPNPANESISMNYTLDESCSVKLALLDICGRVIHTFTDDKASAGVYSHLLNVRELNLAKGIYFSRLMINGNSLVKKLIVQ